MFESIGTENELSKLSWVPIQQPGFTNQVYTTTFYIMEY